MVIPGIFEEKIEDAIRELNLVGNIADKIQLDIADGRLVDGKTFMDLSFLFDVNIHSEIQLHLMVQKPESFLITLPPVIKDVCVQAEAFTNNPLCMESFDDVLRAKDVCVGLSFNIQTQLDDLEGYIKQCDYCQLMTITPGGQGRQFLMESMGKIAMFKGKYPDKRLQVDGGITRENLNMVIEAGADDVIVGSGLFKSPDPAQTYKEFVLQFENAQRNFFDSRRSFKLSDEESIG
jgi:ribulose-phosphate 3-epimerase